MKIFEVEFVYDDYDKREAADVGSRKNPFRMRMIYPPNREYDDTYWSLNHNVIRDEFKRLHNPLTGKNGYDRKYWVYAIRRVR